MSIKNYIKRGITYILQGQPVYETRVNVTVSSPSSALKGRNILVTGGSSGIGLSIAKKCVSEGAKVVITGRNENKLIAAQKEMGTNCSYSVFDSTDTDNITSLFIKAENQFFKSCVDSFVSNAGISLHEGYFKNVTMESWDAQMDLNLKANYFAVKSFIEYLEMKQVKGNILVVTSERAQRPDDIPYGLTKAATSSFIKAFAHRIIKNNIRINGIAPGVTATEMTGFDKNGNLYNSWQPSKRVFLPEEVAEVASFLLSDYSGCISGEIIHCNLGNHIVTW